MSAPLAGFGRTLRAVAALLFCVATHGEAGVAAIANELPDQNSSVSAVSRAVHPMLETQFALEGNPPPTPARQLLSANAVSIFGKGAHWEAPTRGTGDSGLITFFAIPGIRGEAGVDVGAPAVEYGITTTARNLSRTSVTISESPYSVPGDRSPEIEIKATPERLPQTSGGALPNMRPIPLPPSVWSGLSGLLLLGLLTAGRRLRRVIGCPR